MVWDMEFYVLAILWWALLAVKAFALGDAVFRKDAAYVANDKQNKAFWLIILAVFLVLHVLLPSPIQILNLIGAVAAFVYLADVRPTLRSTQSYY